MGYAASNNDQFTKLVQFGDPMQFERLSFGSPINLTSKGAVNMDFSQVTDTPNFDAGASLEYFLSGMDVNNFANIGNWDVSNVTNIDSMFDNAESFNQSLEKWKLKKLEAPELKFDFDINQWMTNNSSIKITDEFKLNNSENEFILIDYKFNGGDDFNFNIFNNETFEDEVYVGSPSSSELTIKVNNTLIYVKHFELEDGPIKEGIYLGVSLDPGFKNIEWYEYDFGCGRNSDLIDIIGILSVGLRDEDFVSHYDEFDYYEEFSKVELNIQIDVKKLKEKWLEVVIPLLEKSNLKVPAEDTWNPCNGGRYGKHTKHLQPLLDEMTEVFTIDPTADW